MTSVDSVIKPVVATGSSRLADMVQMANGLNAARLFASIFVVLLHSAIPYMVSPVPAWVLHDSTQHGSIDVMVIWVNGFVMPLFFLLAGLSVAKSSLQTPIRKFASHRLRRLGSTFLLATVLIVPPLLVCWGLGLLWTERVTMAHLTRMSFPDELNRYFGPVHLWFLEYLMVLSICWSVVVRVAQYWPLAARVVQGRWAHAAMGSVWGPLVLAVPTAMIFSFDIETPFRLITPFLPDVARTLHYSIFFIAGVWLSGLPQSLATLRTHAPVHLLVAAVAFAALCPLTLDWFDKSLGTQGQWMLAILQAIFAWCMVFGFLGAMMRYCSNRSESIRYGNEASFWLYLAHFPVVCAMQLVVWPLQISPWGKLLIVATTGVVVSLLAYELFVRYSWLGAVVNGSRKFHTRLRGWRLEAGWLSLVVVAVLSTAGFLWTGWESFSGPNLHTVVARSIYRSNRLAPNELEETIKEHNIRTVISLASGNANERWFRTQQEVCNRHNISLITFEFDEFLVPSATQLEQLQLELKHCLHPVLLVGGNRSPTLSGFGSAIALLVDGNSLDQALGQLSIRYFQLEGAEHCIVARPLREYRAWLNSSVLNHSAETFGQWTRQVQTVQESMANGGNRQPEWQTMMGAPRYPRRY